MGMTNAALERLRVGLFHMVKLEERHAGTPRRVTASMIVPFMTATLNIAESAAYANLRAGRDTGYIEDDTDITVGPNRNSHPIHITDKGRALLGHWQEIAVAEGTRLREDDQAQMPPALPDKAG